MRFQQKKHQNSDALKFILNKSIFYFWFKCYDSKQTFYSTT